MKQLLQCLMILFLSLSATVWAEVTVDSDKISINNEGNMLAVSISFANDSKDPYAGDLSITLLDKDYNTTAEVVKKLFIVNGKQMEQISVPIPKGYKDAPVVRIDFMNHTWIKRPSADITGQEYHIIGQKEWLSGSTAQIRVIVTQSLKNQPIENAIISGVLSTKDEKKSIATIQAVSDKNGCAALKFDIPQSQQGEYVLSFSIECLGKKSAITTDIRILPGTKIFLTTDKPVYQPKQTMHIRALASQKSSGQPLEGKDITLEVYDGKGNKVFKQVKKSSEFGIVFADFQLADEVNQGDYAVKALLGDDVSEKTVNVYEYVLPKFKVSVENKEKFYTPGSEVKGKLEARYFFGKAVDNAKVTIVANCFDVGFNEFAKVEGKTDKEGKFEYLFKIPEKLVGQPAFKGNTIIQMDMRVKDTADHQEQKIETFHVATDPLQFEAIPESGSLVYGVSNEIFIIASRPDGSVAKPKIRVVSKYQENSGTSLIQNVAKSFLNKETELQCDENGIASFFITPTTIADQSKDPVLHITAEDGGKTISVDKDFSRDPDKTILIRPDKGVYKVGDKMEIQIFAPGRKDNTVFLDIVKNNQTILTHTFRLSESHRLTMPVDNSLAGTLALNAYIIRGDGNMIRDTRQVVVVRSDDLHIDIVPDLQEYLPGQPAAIKIAVHDPSGAPVQTALGMHIVDESVYSLTEKEPGLAKVFFAIEKELLNPKIEIHGFQMDKVVRLSSEKYSENANLSKALLCKINTLSNFNLNINSASEKIQKVQSDLNTLSQFMGRTGFKASAKPRTVEEIAFEQNSKSSAQNFVDPWGNAYLVYADQNQQITFCSIGSDGVFGTEDDIKVNPHFFGLMRGGKVLVNKAMPKGAIRRGAVVRDLKEEGVVEERLVEVQAQVAPMMDAAGGAVMAERAMPAAMPDMAGRMGGMGGMGMGGMMAGKAEGKAFGKAMEENSDESDFIRTEGSLVNRIPAKQKSSDNLLSLGYLGKPQDQNENSDKFNFVIESIDSIGNTNLTKKDDGQPLAIDGQVNPEALKHAADAYIDKKIDRKVVQVPVPVLEEKKKKEDIRIRKYFPETLFYTPEMITDAKGEASISLAMADSITTWRMSAMANAKSGAIGDTTAAMKVFKPFFVDLDLPVALIQNDQVTIPVAVYNYLPTPQTIDIELEKLPWFELLQGDYKRHVEVAANEVTSVSFPIKAKKLGEFAITVFAIGSKDNDAISRNIEVRPNGEARFVTQNGSLRQTVDAKVDFPAGRVPGADKLFVKVYPGLFSQIVEGLDAILKMPYGCFEQTSSTTYPNILALDYMRQSGRVTPAIEMKALEYINLGYQRLLTFEIAGGGFQVFGSPPATRILSAYGLLEFGDMNKVYPIDANVIERTQRWLMGQMAQDGSWEPDQNYSHAEMWQSIQNNKVLVSAYIAMALANSGLKQGLEKPKEYLIAHAEEAKDAYTLSILCNALLALDKENLATKKCLGRLVNMATIEGDMMYWRSEASLSFARGDNASVEVTAWGALAFIESDGYGQELGKVLNWIISKKDPNGTWGTTHGTVLALKALIKSLKSRTESSTATVTVKVNGQDAAKVDITPENSDLFHDMNITRFAKDGENKVQIGFEGKGRLLYQVVGKYFVPWDKKEKKESPFTINVKYDRTDLQRNDTVTCQVTAKNQTKARAEMVMIDLGVPPGFQVERPALEDYVKQNKIAKYTIMSRQVLIYLEYVDGNQEIQLNVPMKATLPIVAKAPESTIYEYYNPDVKKTSEPQEIKVQ